jgi:hypothetical protein
MNEISIGLVGWGNDLQRASDALWNTRIIADSAIELDNNTLTDIVQIQTSMHELNEVVIDYLEVAVKDVTKMREAGNRVARSDGMMSRIFGGGN